MKLPSFSQSTAQALTPQSTPQAAAAVAAAPYETAAVASDVANEVYKATTAASYTRAAANFIAGYTESMAEFERSPNVSVDELQSMGLDVPADYVESVLTDDGVYRDYVPNWAVAEQFHKRLVGNLIDEGVATAKTEAARSRFRTDFTEKYGNEQLLAVQRTAFKQMQQYHATQLFNDVNDMFHHGNYDEAYKALVRGVASDTITQPQFHQAYFELRQRQERAGYEETIETGSIDEQRELLSSLLYSMENEGRYGGALTPGERTQFINRLQANIATTQKVTKQADSVASDLTRVEKALDRMDTIDPKLMEKLQADVEAKGNPTYQNKIDGLQKAIEVQQAYKLLPQPELTRLEDTLRHQSATDTVSLYVRERLGEFSAWRDRQVRADPQGYFNEYGPTSVGDGEKNELLAISKQDVLTDPSQFTDIVMAREALSRERAYFLGVSEPTLLSRDEQMGFNVIFNTETMEVKREALGLISTLPAELADDVYAELTSVAQKDSAIFLAAGKHFQNKQRINGDLLLLAYQDRNSPNMQKYTSSKGLKQAIDSQLSNFSLVTGSKAKESMQQAVLMTYAYFAGMQGVEPGEVDVDLLAQATDLALGSTLSDVGRTRLLKIRGQSTEDTNRILKNSPAHTWERAFEGVEFSEATPINFESLPASLRNGETWFINVPGSNRNVFMVRPDERGVPTLVFDSDGDPVMLDFSNMPRQIEPSVLEKGWRSVFD